jgi:long-chain acyl-CoA synthetase
LIQRTLVDLFRESAEENADEVAMRYKREGTWQEVTYEGFQQYVEDLAGGLLYLDVEPGDRVSIWSDNSPEWVIADYATMHVGAVTAPIYETLPADQAGYILEDSGAKVVFVEDEEKLEGVLSQQGRLDELEHIVVMGSVPEGYQDKADIVAMEELYTQGATYNEQLPDEMEGRVDDLGPEDLASCVYTSGTTGDPKGVMLTHGNVASNVEATAEALPVGDEIHLAFLPLAHSFARTGDEFVPYSTGSTVCFAEGLDELRDNMQEVEPTVMLSVPRLYEKMHQSIQDRMAEQNPIVERLFAWATDVGWEVAQRKIAGEEPGGLLAVKKRLADRLILDKLQEITGGRLKFFVSGGAALNPAIMKFFASADLWIMQGYGLTETSPVISANTPDDYRIGSVGRPLDAVEVRIAEDRWEGSEEEGEIQVKGPNVTQGYHERPEQTGELFTDDGWLRTGDVGRIDEDGFLYVTDRLKKIFKTAYGKYIVPNKIEGRLKERPFVEQAVVVGEDRKFVSALLAPDFEQLEAWAEDEGIGYEDHADLVTKQAARDRIWEEVETVNENLARYESLKEVALLPRLLDEEHDELTPTMKIKRRVVHEHFADEIEAMYPDE